jgi:hypothetical protein
MVGQIILDYGRIWGDLVRSEKVLTECPEEGTPNKIEIGVRMSSGIPKYYADRVGPDGKREDLKQEITERFIEGTSSIVQINRPRGKKIQGKGEKPPCIFYCDQPLEPLSLLNREMKLALSVNGRTYGLFHNAFPIEESGHFLYVPVKFHKGAMTLPHKPNPQAISKDRIEDFLYIFSQSQDMVMFFNGMGAGASVDHFHFQVVPYIRTIKTKDGVKELPEQKLGLERALIEECGNGRRIVTTPINRGYVHELNEAELIWREVNCFQEKKIPLNWILMGGRSYLFPRKDYKNSKHESAVSRLAGYEHTGKIITIKEDHSLSKELLEEYRATMAYSREELELGI